MIIEQDNGGQFRRTQDKRFYFFESELADGRLVRAQRKYWWSARKRVRREHVPVSVNRLVWRRDQGRCVNCGSQERLEFDHIIPVAKGGSNTARNLQLLCERCNRKKGARIV